MIDGCPEPDVEFDASRLRNECFCYRATLDELLADEGDGACSACAGYKSDEFREMMTEMAWNLVTP